MRYVRTGFVELCLGLLLAVLIATVCGLTEPRGAASAPDEVSLLAAAVCSEGCYEPEEAQDWIARTILHEAIRRRVTIYALLHTPYLTGLRYAELHPDSWQASIFRSPPEKQLVIARMAYTWGVLSNAPANYFDGAMLVYVLDPASNSTLEDYACLPHPVWNTAGNVPFVAQIGRVCFYGAAQ